MTEPLIGRKSVWQKQFPTLIGLVFLVVALGVGVFFFGAGGLGVFAPRATPQTTPKNIKITNVTDNTFSVSFLTDETTSGFVKYGTTADNLKTQSSDDRDQLSGSVSQFSTHHMTVRNLQPSTLYYFTLGTGSTSDFNNEGEPFTVRTGALTNNTGTAKTIYGNVVTSDGRPADGSIVYVKSENMGEMSTLVKSSGSWAVALAAARTTDLNNLATFEDNTPINILVQGSLASQISQTTTTVTEAQPVASITLGGSNSAAAGVGGTSDVRGLPGEGVPEIDNDILPTNITEAPLATPLAEPVTDPGQLGDLLVTGPARISAESVIVDLTQTAPQTVTTSQPIILGTAAPNVLVTIEIHSENQVSQQLVTDENGDFVFDMSQLSTQLEPGEHTATFSYVDPTSGKTVTKTQTFTVVANTNQAATQASSTLLAQAGPFSSGNPFPITSPTVTASASPISTRSATAAARPSTQSGLPVSGSTGTTVALLMGGVFFILAGIWSYWVAQQVRENAND